MDNIYIMHNNNIYIHIYTLWKQLLRSQNPCHPAPPLRRFQGIGPMDGSVSRIPDRRIDAMHTLYRDAQAPKGPRVMW